MMRILPRSLIVFSLRLVLASVAVGAFFVFTQDLQFFPGLVTGYLDKARAEPDKIPKGVDLHIVETEDGELLEAWHIPLDGHGEVANIAVAILFHGNGETVRSTFGLQKWFQANGIATVAFDYRGYGNSTGWPSDRGLKQDVKAILKLVERLYEPGVPLVIFGSSIGTGLAAYAATLVEHKALVLLAPYTSLTELVRDQKFLSILSSFVWYDFNILQLAQTQASACTIVSHGLRDRIINVEHGRAVAAALSKSPQAHYFEIEEAGHNDLLSKVGDRLMQSLKACVGG